MCRTVLRRAAGLAILLLPAACATSVPRLSFEQLTDASEVIASGEVTQSWAAWDSEHKYIWTHYRLSVNDVAKGARTSSVEFAEPGGALGAVSMMIPGTVSYAVGEQVTVFLARMPNGYLRTAGWAQGKYTLDEKGTLHSHAGIGAEFVDVKTATVGVSLQTLEGLSFTDLKRRIAARTGRVQ